MKNKVYYGEYTLKHWKDLIDTGNIVLPEYQRSLSWDKNKINQFIEALRNDQFVPPVTIASMCIDGVKKNYIIDGQQRLSSLLLFYHNIYPEKKYFNNLDVMYDEDVEDSDDLSSIDLKWRLEEIAGSTNIDSTKYTSLNDNPISDRDSFLQKHYLGFSYIVPLEEKEEEQIHFFSTMFRDINISGNQLSPIESRRSLYFTNKKYKEFFDTQIFDSFHVKQLTDTKKIDAVRYFSLLSQYKKNGSETNIAARYGASKEREKYYLEYISSIIYLDPIRTKKNQLESLKKGCSTGEFDQQSKLDDVLKEYRAKTSMFGDFFDVFPDGNYSDRLEKLKGYLQDSLSPIPKSFNSIIEADMYLFGLIYSVLFKDKNIQVSDDLIKELTDYISKSKVDQTRSPNRLMFIRERIAKSINIYAKYES